MGTLGLIFGSIFLSNILLSFLVGYPFINNETKLKDVVIVGVKTLVLTIVTTVILFPISHYLLKPEGWEFLTPLLAILLVLNLHNLSNLLLSKLNLENYINKDFDLYVPFNAVVISAALIITSQASYLGAVGTALGLSLGYLLVTILIYTIRPRLILPGIPKAFKGIPLLLITLGFIAMVFVGLGGIL